MFKQRVIYDEQEIVRKSDFFSFLLQGKLCLSPRFGWCLNRLLFDLLFVG